MTQTTNSLWSRVSPWLWAAGTVLLVGGTGLATWRFSRVPLAPAGVASAPVDAPPGLTSGHDYYLHVKLIELAERRPNGKQWDSIDDSGPDVRFNLTWHDNVIWKSIEKPNTLIGSWDLMRVDLRQVITSGGQTDLEGLVNAPLVHYTVGAVVTLKVWDEDTVGSDDAGTLTIKLDELRPGENTLLPPGDGSASVKRVVLALIDRRTPMPELVNMISNR
jgi:hypothetical protein